MASWKEIKKKKWFQTVAGVAPLIAGSLGGPWGAVAGAALKKALGLPENATDLELANKVENASAADIIKIREADNTFKIEMGKLGVKETELYLGDVQDARARHVAVRDKMPAYLAVLGWAQWILVLVVTLFGSKIGVEFDAEQRAILMFVLATSQAMALSGYNFFLGSSQGSKEKTDAFAAWMKSQQE